MAISNSDLEKLRADLATKATEEALGYSAGTGSEELLNDLYGDIDAAENYDFKTDPSYSALKKSAEKEADQTMRDVLAQGNVKSNGFANSAAITAASQARDSTMSQFDTKVQELEEAALNRKYQQISAKMSLLSAVEGMESTKRQNYLNDLALLEEQASSENTAAQTEVQNIISMGGVPSDELLAKTGWSQEYISAVKQNSFNNMDTASMQQYLNSQGANLDVDGQWGPKTEAAYVAVFGKSSGRQTSYGSNPSYTPKVADDTGSGSNDAMSIDEVRRDISVGMKYNGMTKSDAESYVDDLYQYGKISKYQANELKKGIK